MENSTQKTQQEILKYAKPRIKSVISYDGEVYTDREVLERIQEILKKAGGEHTEAFQFVSKIDHVTEDEGGILDDFIKAYLDEPVTKINVQEITTLLNQVEHQLFVVVGRRAGEEDRAMFIDAENHRSAEIKASLLIAKDEGFKLGEIDIYTDNVVTLTEYLQNGIIQ